MLGRAMRIGFSATTTTTTTTTTTATIGRFLLSTCLLTVHHHFHPLSPRVQAFSMATTGTMTTTTTTAIHTRRRRRRTTTTVALAATNQNEPSSLAVPVTPSPQKPTVQKRRRLSSPTKTKSTTVSSKTKTKTPPIATGQLTSTLVSAINPDQPYIDLKIPPGELRPSATLTTGQCFHWKAVQQDTDTDPSEETQDVLASTDLVPTKKQSAWGAHDATEWVGTIRMTDGLSVVLAIRETPSTTLFRPLTTNVSNERLFAFLYDYFRLASNDDDSSSLTKLYQEWSKADERLAIIAKCIPGVRIIEQDPFECLLSFICSSNNNIPRITKMLSAIRANYGDHLLTIGNDLEFYSFPSLEQLSAKATDEDLRTKCGLGYRSKYILETLKVLQSKKQTEKGGVGGGEAYLHGLRDVSDPRIVQEKLCEFCGVGRKVADCVALFSLRQDDAIPVDVHVWNIARRDFCDPSNENDDLLLANANKSLTPATYWKVGDLFRSRFQEKAGWAHSLLFVAELPSFRPVLPQELVDEMDRFAQDEKAKKEQEKKNKNKKNEQKKTTKQEATTKPAKGKVKGRTTKAKTKSVD